jgi:hypothetical protein
LSFMPKKFPQGLMVKGWGRLVCHRMKNIHVLMQQQSYIIIKSYSHKCWQLSINFVRIFGRTYEKTLSHCS